MARRASHERRSANPDNPGNVQPQRLILCFDGTGNSFQGSPGDTNIVKLYNMLDRVNVNQMHYYQPGIGTYPAEGPVNVGFFRRMWRSFEAVIDQALATSFDAHVIAGYRFIMRYYNPGDRIYIFGFSRGAFTARFLARMLSHIGLLSRGNDEMVPFAYRVYQQYEQNQGSADEITKHTAYMNAFKRHFCRTELVNKEQRKLSDNESGIKVHFLGLFDCVSSVGTLDVPFFKKMPPLPKVSGTANYVRHAVAIDERRVKFKAALFSQERTEVTDKIKEVWFPGNHGDIGGGWVDVSKSKTSGPVTDPTNDYFQLSDIALKWMVDEIDDVEQQEIAKLAETEKNKPETERTKYETFAWDSAEKGSFLQRFEHHKKDMIKATMHDTMKIKGGSDFSKVLLWNLMEYLPFIKRWEFIKTKDTNVKGGYIWQYVMFPLNRGGRRDIPNTALFHHAIIDRMRQKDDVAAYLPTNNLWVKRGPRDTKVDSDTQLTEKRLDDLANQYKGDKQYVNGVEGGSPVFVKEEGELAGVGSTVIENEKVARRPPAEWDQLYHVELN